MSAEVLTQAIDPASDRAVYKQIADHLREAISRGRLKEGDQLPSEAQLMGHYGVARMTIRNALRLLQDEGLITAEHGRGVYVRARPPVRRLASDRFAQRHRKEGKAAFIAEAEQVGATPAVDMIKVSEATATGRGRRPARASMTTPEWWCAPAGTCSTAARWRRPSPTSRPTSPRARRSPTRTPARAASTPGWKSRATPWRGSPRKSRPGCPPREEARVLALPPGVPVFRLVRTAYDMDGRAVEVCDTIMAADAYLLAYELPAH